MGVIFEANRLGVRVPQDLSVIGIDDHDFSDAIGLTTVGQRPDEQAELGTKMLLDELLGIPDRCGPPSRPMPDRQTHDGAAPVLLAVPHPTAWGAGCRAGKHAGYEARASWRMGIQREASRR
jgi:hypothetical protein